MDYEANAGKDKEQSSSINNLIFYSGIVLVVSSFILPVFMNMIASDRANRMTKLVSSTQSSIVIQPTTVSLRLPKDSFVYGEHGGSVIGDSLLEFNEGSNDLSFHVSYPTLDVQKSFTVHLFGAYDHITYKLTTEMNGYDYAVVSVRFRVSGLDTSLVWYADGKRVMPSADGSIEVTLPKVSSGFAEASDMVYLTGYSGVDNSLRDGVIINYDRK